ncbi:MAG: aminotransferase class I/II-fold pyridoxal phosphate-dependent enzyme [Vicinamibacterales bacterium]
MAFKPDDFSLADFHLSDLDSTDPTVPPADFTEWRRATTWASQLYEPTLRTAPVPRVELQMADGPRAEINLTSYNYLGLGTHPEVVAAASAALREFGTGACGSPLLSGKTTIHRAFEEELAQFLQREAVVLFNSGFSGALGSLAGLLRRDDVAVVDSKSHVSLVDGARLSGARVMTFEHNQPDDLDRVLAQSRGKRRLVVAEGVYSMDGDRSCLADLVAVAEEHGAPMLVDEAHSILTCGAQGRGVVEESGMNDRVRLQYGTFSKAFAGLGGFVAGPAETIDYLRCYASSYGFSCALPAATVAGLRAALRVAREQPELRARLWENAAYFREGARALGLNTGESDTYVVPLIVGGRRGLLYEVGNALRRRGLFLAPVDYPSVPQEEVRFRASVTAAHTRADLDEALNILADVMAPALRIG